MSEPYSSSADWPLDQVMRLKGAATVAVVIPARNEQDSVGGVVSAIAEDLDDFIDELIVMDSLSDDRTSDVASEAGARVFSVADVRADLGVHAGKGEALWKSLFVTRADIVAFIDADLTEWGTHFVRGVVGPLLADEESVLCRGFYDRVMDVDGHPTLEGGRVTELVARPWLALFRPELSRVVQPLAGEWAIRRSAFERMHVPVGYGVELSTLLDAHDQWGLGAIAQVDLGRRAHRHQNIHDLSAMATEILATAERRRAGFRGLDIAPLETEEVQLAHLSEERAWQDRTIVVAERPPAVTQSPFSG